ncbi:Forkhead-associated (FHA) domain [Dillenia turbinata]|uniref:Forkhead-associated (FHA) domain n=1 Tax=Dillenia turbinata TaxID=194707 RepID=A0AAN8VM14_9MAGN
MEKTSTLKLIFEKGPLEGETLDFNPKASRRVKIGRVVKGNTLSIKDAGISTKHLSLDFVSNKWKISDLGSSNGTFINGVSIPASKPWDLEDGDLVKIGECTSFKVSIQDEESENQVPRNPRRRGAVPVEERIEEEIERLNLGSQVENRVTRGRAKKIRALKEENLSLNKRCGDGERMEGRVEEDDGKVDNLGNIVENKVKRGRWKKFADLKNEPEIEKCDDDDKVGNLGNAVVNGVKGVRGKKTRDLKNRPENESFGIHGKDGDLDLSQEQEIVEGLTLRSTKGSDNGGKSYEKRDDGEQVGNLGNVVEKKVKRGRPKRTQNLKNETDIVSSGVQEKDGDLGLSQQAENVAERMSLRRTRSSKNDVEKVIGSSLVNEENGNARGQTRRGQVLEDEKLESAPVRALEDEKIVEEDETVADEANIVRATGKESVSSSGVKESGGEVNNESDLEKMTLGQWFDYLEVNLPKQIISETEEMIFEMQQKAKQFHDFLLQQQAEKDFKHITVRTELSEPRIACNTRPPHGNLESNNV